MGTYKECERLAADIRQRAADLELLAQFIETEGVKLPSLPWMSRNESHTVWLTESSSYRDVYGDWRSKVDEPATKQNVKKFLDVVGNCDKEYTDHSLVITKKIGSTVSIKGTMDREAICKKIVKKREYVKHTSDGYWKEDVEWDCETPSLINFVNS